MTDSPLISAALDYAGRDWPVLPLERGGKRPLGRLVPHGVKDATTDPEQVRRWWTSAPLANIGLVTGLAFDVLDIDGPDALERLEARNDCPPGADGEGPTVATPRGWHRYVAPTGRGCAVNLGGLAGIDWRGRGGYVVAPPSVRDGGGSWDWTAGSLSGLTPDALFAPAPAWALRLFDCRSRPASVTSSVPRHPGRTAYGSAALERELGRLVMAVEGTRNDQLNRSAHALGQLVGARVLTAQEVGNALLTAALRIGLDEAEADATIRSGMTAGIGQPRKVAS
jgi:hypothetical protein